MCEHLTPLEVAASWVHGITADEPLARSGATPRAALESVILENADRPTFVAFSGGRDSSMLLAVATDVARKHGLDDPVPITESYSGNADADETRWQDFVVRHLRLSDWCRVEMRDDADLLGGTAQRSLRRHGLIWPPAAHLKSPVLSVARGGVLLTGEGGDEVLGSTRNGPLREVLVEHRWHGKPHATALSEALAPRPIRQQSAHIRLRRADLQPWLTAEAKEHHLRLLAHDLAGEPLSRATGIDWLTRRRAVTVSCANRRAVAADQDVDVIDPLLHPRVVAALLARAGFWGWRGRTTAMMGLAGDLLPPSVLDRRSKALFNTAFFGRESRQFAQQWDGAGLDPALVRAEALRREWLSPRPSALSFLPLQAAWLSQQGPGASP